MTALEGRRHSLEVAVAATVVVVGVNQASSRPLGRGTAVSRIITSLLEVARLAAIAVAAPSAI